MASHLQRSRRGLPLGRRRSNRQVGATTRSAQSAIAPRFTSVGPLPQRIGPVGHAVDATMPVCPSPPWRLGAGVGSAQQHSPSQHELSQHEPSQVQVPQHGHIAITSFRVVKGRAGTRSPAAGRGSRDPGRPPALRAARPAAPQAASSPCRSRRRGAPAAPRWARTRILRCRGRRAARGSPPAAARAAARRG